MTKIELHSVPDFINLYIDPRFLKLIEYLKTEMPKEDRYKNFSGDWYRGVHAVIATIESLEEMPVVPKKASEDPRPLYQQASLRMENQIRAY